MRVTTGRERGAAGRGVSGETGRKRAFKKRKETKKERENEARRRKRRQERKR